MDQWFDIIRRRRLFGMTGRPRTILIVQARMGSSRLPGKVLMPILGRPMLLHQMDRLRRTTRSDGLVVATTTSPRDDGLAATLTDDGVDVFRGSEQDVLSRYALCAEAHEAETILRVTGDCPMVDPTLIDELIDYFHNATPSLDYAGIHTGTYPRGLDCEIMSRAALDAAHAEATHVEHREHVTPFLHRQPDRFRIGFLTNLEPVSGYRLCVDESVDFEVVSQSIEDLLAISPTYTWRDIVTYMDSHPDVRTKNLGVPQVALSESAL